jgi:hypothetical protein
MRLNNEKLPGPRSATWAPSAIREILHNPTYTGVRTFGRIKKVRLKTGRRSKRTRPESEWTVVSGAHPAIIDLDTWARVQAALAAALRRACPSLGAVRRARSEYVLVGLVKCGSCGGNFTLKIGNLMERLAALSPEAVRNYLKQMIQQVTVHADGRAAVEGTYSPLACEGLKRIGNGGDGTEETVRTTLVPGDRHQRCAHGLEWAGLVDWKEELPLCLS